MSASATGRTMAIGVALCVTAIPAASIAGVINDVPSCYKANKLDVPARDLDHREIYVMIDQTTILDENLKRSVLANVWNYLVPNTSYTIATFSAFSQGRYTDVVAAGTIEADFPGKDRESTSERLLQSLDQCLQEQENWARRHATDAIKKAFGASSPELAKSDILAAIQDVSARVSASTAKTKILFIVSDMLENSSITSFYASGSRVRRIVPDRELALVKQAKLSATLTGVRVDILGAGIIGPVAGHTAAYRDTNSMAALREFWKRWLEYSGAQLEQFGEPALLQQIE